MNEAPKVKLSKADVVKRFNVSRVTLDRYIKVGKISAVKGDRIGSSEPPKYEWEIELSEVQRVFKQRGSKAEKTPKKDSEVELQLLRQKVEMLEQQLRDKDEQVRETIRNKNEWKQQFENTQARLEHQSRSFFKKLFG